MLHHMSTWATIFFFHPSYFKSFSKFCLNSWQMNMLLMLYFCMERTTVKASNGGTSCSQLHKILTFVHLHLTNKEATVAVVVFLESLKASWFMKDGDFKQIKIIIECHLKLLHIFSIMLEIQKWQIIIL